MLRSIGIASALVFVLSGISGAEWLQIGSTDIGLADMTSGGKPTTLVIREFSDISDYAFDGSDLEIPFTLEGAGATVYLVIYTVDQHPSLTITGEGPGPHNDPEHGAAGWHVFDDVDMLVFKSDGVRLEEGANSIVWNGRDLNGDVVSSGSYDLFLAAFDDEATPHVVGTIRPNTGSVHQLIVDTNRGLMFGPSEYVNNMENDWVENLLGRDEINLQEVEAACGENCSSRIHNGTPLNADYTEWIGNINGGGGWLVRYNFDWDANQVTPVTDWAQDAGATDGILSCGDNLPGRQYASITNPEKTIVWAGSGVSGTVAKLIGWSVETGDLVSGKDWDLSEIFMYDNNGSDRVGGIGWLSRMSDGEPDPFGITTTGHHTSVILRLDYDGNVKYINRNGDGFGDVEAFANGAFSGGLIYGHTEAPSFKYSIYSTKWGWTVYPAGGADVVNYGYVLGEDGSGLFQLQPKNIPSSFPDHIMIVDDNESDWDGVYLSVGGVEGGAASNDWMSVITDDPNPTTPPLLPVVQMPYDQKRVRLGEATTAVSEIESDVLPASYELGNAYPNPFNPETTISFSLPWEVDMTVKIFNEQGQFVRDLVNDRMGPGEFTVTWDGTDANGVKVSSGVYIYKIQGPNLGMSKKVTLLK
jgi:flagellar hook assembly protein FlgD